jgi:hypothetical protein
VILVLADYIEANSTCPGNNVCPPPMPPGHMQFQTWRWDGYSLHQLAPAPLPDQDVGYGLGLAVDPRNGQLALMDDSSFNSPTGTGFVVGAISDLTPAGWTPATLNVTDGDINTISGLIGDPAQGCIMLIGPYLGSYAPTATVPLERVDVVHRARASERGHLRLP